MKLTRGMTRRNERLARRAAFAGDHTLVAAIDIARRESVVVFIRKADKARVGVLRMKTSLAGVQELQRSGQRLLESQGLERMVIGMEATSHYWKILAAAATKLGIPYVTVQSFSMKRMREMDDLTRDKNDLRDAGLIGDMVCDLRFNEVQLESGVWAPLRLLAEARQDRRVELTAALLEQRALIELAWPQLLETARSLDGKHVQAVLRLGLSPAQIAALPMASFRGQLAAEFGPGLFRGSLAERIWQTAGAVGEAPEMSALSLRWCHAALRAQAAVRAIAQIDGQMQSAFEETGLDHLRGQLRGLGDILLINLLALSGDPRRLDSGRCLVKLAGTNPTERSSGETTAAGGIHRRGRPNLRLVAYQAAVCLVLHNEDFRRRFQFLITRSCNPLSKQQAYVAVANKLLRVIWALALSGERYCSPGQQAIAA